METTKAKLAQDRRRGRKYYCRNDRSLGGIFDMDASDEQGRTNTRRRLRQALDAHSKVKIAYQTRKARLRKVFASVRAGKSDMDDLPPELGLALQRAAAFQARGDRLQATSALMTPNS